MKSVLVFPYRSAGPDCSNHGLTSWAKNMWLFSDCTKEEAIAWCEKNDENPKHHLYLVPRMLWGEPHYYAEPLIIPENKAQTFGGNFVYTSDSRLPKTGSVKVPIPVHDRFDTWEDFDAMSI